MGLNIKRLGLEKASQGLSRGLEGLLNPLEADRCCWNKKGQDSFHANKCVLLDNQVGINFVVPAEGVCLLSSIEGQKKISNFRGN
jgi:hypothetical protein